jgi:hypothetical protein
MGARNEMLLNIADKEWEGFTLPDLDPKRQGRYRVHIPQLMDQMEENEGIWCRNHCSSGNLTPSNRGVYGSQLPLQPNTKVIVKFRMNSLNSGYIEKIVSDSEPNSNVDVGKNESSTPVISEFDRDEQYIVMKTPKRYQIMYMNEDTSTDPNTIFIVFNRDNGPTSGRSITKYSEDGIHHYTRNNYRERILQDKTVQIDENYMNKIAGKKKTSIGTSNHLSIGEDNIIEIGGKKHEKIKTEYVIQVDEIQIQAKNIVFKGSESIVIDAPVVAINTGPNDKSVDTPEPTPIVPKLEE